MKATANTLELKFERTIPASPEEVYDAWLDPKVPGNPWHESDKLLLNPKVDGMFYWLTRGTAHYGLFTKMERPGRIQHTWVSPYTLGMESTVTLTFEKRGKETLMTLVHSNLPDSDEGRKHEGGWNYFLGNFAGQFGEVSRKKS